MVIYLYVKVHKITRLKYLGKTTKDPYKYKGSGKYWTAHIKKHGNDIDTFIIRECTSNAEVKQWGTYFSLLWDVVNSNEWANLIVEEGSGGNASQFWTDIFREENKRARQKWTNFQNGKTYEEIYGNDKALLIKKKISSAGKGKKLNLTDIERTRRSNRMRFNNPGKYAINNESIDKRVKTFKSNGSNIGNKNGMNTKPESRILIGEKNSKVHHLVNILTGEKIDIKNITKWAIDQKLNPKSVLVWFCKGKIVNNCKRLGTSR